MNRAREIFGEALAFPPGEARDAHLRAACAGDELLLEEVRSLLEAHESADEDFLEDCPALRPWRGRALREAPVAEGPGTDVGRYRLLEKIGEGGFGVVYMAEQREPVRRKVALKIVKLGMDTRQVVGRFEVERQALALMEHPNIARVLDGGATETGRPFFVMELVRGTPITQFCDEAEATTEERLELFIQVCSAIQHAHQKGVIHRDIKPSNVLVTMHDDRPVPKVIDFGIAKAMQKELADRTVFTRFHELLGTPAYMSPEQAQLNGIDVDTRTDIYSLGVLLYELLTGQTPFDARRLLGAGYDELCRTIRDVEPLKPSTRLNTLSLEDRTLVARRRRTDVRHVSRRLRGDLDRIVMKALEKDRTRRYESASALANDIRRHLAHEPVTAVAPSLGYRLRKFARRHRTALPFAAGFLLLLVATSLVSTWLAVRAIHAESMTQSLLETEMTARAQLEQLLVQLQEARQRADEEARRARAEAATAEAVSRFLNEDVFGMADPENGPQREVTLRAAMDRAARQLPGSLSNQPLAVAAVHTTIGRAYANLGQYAQAQEQLQQAHAIYERELGESHPTAIGALRLVSWALEQGGMTTPALAVSERAWQLSRDALGEHHPLTIQSLSRLAWSYYRLRREKEAFAAAAEAWSVAQSLPGTPEIDAYSALYLMARRHGLDGRVEEGEALLRRALAAHEARFGRWHTRTLPVRNGLAAYYYDHRYHLAEAERLYRDCLDAQIRLVGESHGFCQTIRKNLALLYQETGRSPAALWELLAALRADWSQCGVAADVERLLTQIPDAAEEVVGPSGWRYAPEPPERTWRQEEHDATGWPADPPESGSVRARCEVRLGRVQQGSVWVLRTSGAGPARVHVNGVPAAQSCIATLQRGVRNGGAGEIGTGIGVFTREGITALREGVNVITVEGERTPPDLRLELFVIRPPKAP